MSFKVPVLEHYEWQKSIKDKDLLEPPSAPEKGDRYIVNENSTGTWSTHIKKIAEWNGNDWEYTTPKVGMLLLVEDENILYQYINDDWRDFALIIGKRRVEISEEDILLKIEDCGKVFTSSKNGQITYTLPETTSSDLGIHYTFCKLNSLTNLKIKCSQDSIIADSDKGATIYSNVTTENNSTITLLLVFNNIWSIISGHGTWTMLEE